MAKLPIQALRIQCEAKVSLWGARVGAVREFNNGRISFEYDPAFIKSGQSLSPMLIPLEQRLFEFQGLRKTEAFHGLPGFIADSLPDDFGKRLIRRFYKERGEHEKAMSPVQHLLFLGRDGMGALEYSPSVKSLKEDTRPLDLLAMIESSRQLIKGEGSGAYHALTRIGGIAGGSQPKACVLKRQNKATVRSGLNPPRKDEEHWIIKLDGVGTANVLDKSTRPCPRTEFVYSELARRLGINTVDTDFIEEGGRFHLLNKRFDREGGAKLHKLSLAGMLHCNFHTPQSCSYEEWFRAIMALNLGAEVLEQAYRRMLFNIVARNTNDHPKKMAFVLDAHGWRLAPAYGLNFFGLNTHLRKHQMTAGGRAEGFSKVGLIEIGKQFDLSNTKTIVNQTIEVLSAWPTLAKEMGIPSERINPLLRFD